MVPVCRRLLTGIVPVELNERIEMKNCSPKKQFRKMMREKRKQFIEQNPLRAERARLKRVKAYLNSLAKKTDDEVEPGTPVDLNR